MNVQRFNGIEVGRELSFRQHTVNELVTSTAKQSNPASKFMGRESPFGLGFTMTRSRDKVMLRELNLSATAKLTSSKWHLMIGCFLRPLELKVGVPPQFK